LQHAFRKKSQKYIYILGKNNPWGERAIEVVFVGTTWDSHAIGPVSVQIEDVGSAWAFWVVSWYMILTPTMRIAISREIYCNLWSSCVYEVLVH
jgi:hypothetical protein